MLKNGKHEDLLNEAETLFTDSRGNKPIVNLAISMGSVEKWQLKHDEFMRGVEWAIERYNAELSRSSA